MMVQESGIQVSGTVPSSVSISLHSTFNNYVREKTVEMGEEGSALSAAKRSDCDGGIRG